MAKKPIPQGAFDEPESIKPKPKPEPSSVEPINTDKVLRLIGVSKEDYISYRVTEYEVPSWVLDKYGKKKDQSEPDVGWIFVEHLRKKACEILGI